MQQVVGFLYLTKSYYRYQNIQPYVGFSNTYSLVHAVLQNIMLWSQVKQYKQHKFRNREQTLLIFLCSAVFMKSITKIFFLSMHTDFSLYIWIIIIMLIWVFFTHLVVCLQPVRSVRLLIFLLCRNYYSRFSDDFYLCSEISAMTLASTTSP